MRPSISHSAAQRHIVIKSVKYTDKEKNLKSSKITEVLNGTQLAHSVEHVTPYLGIVGLSPMLGIEIT